MDIAYTLKKDRRTTPFIPDKPLPFGQARSDHMFLMDYDPEKEGWHDPRIVPYGDHFTIAPGATILHYGQGIFEGMKAHQHDDGNIFLFRPELNFKRFNDSAEGICMPQVPEEMQHGGLNALIDLERLWFPQQKDASLYLRPFIFGTEDRLGVHPSNTYTYCVFLSPSGAYFPTGFNAQTMMLTDQFHRAAPGGVGNKKYTGNYARTLLAGKVAHDRGAVQVLYLDVNNKRLDEYGAMFHYQVTQRDPHNPIGNAILLPEFTDTNLRSTTADTMLDLSPLLEKEIGYHVAQSPITLDGFIDGILSGLITETGGLGTAAVVAPVGRYVLDLSKKVIKATTATDEEKRQSGIAHHFTTINELIVGDGQVGEVSSAMYQLLNDIQTGKRESPNPEWLVKVPRMR